MQIFEVRSSAYKTQFSNFTNIYFLLQKLEKITYFYIKFQTIFHESTKYVSHYINKLKQLLELLFIDSSMKLYAAAEKYWSTYKYKKIDA